MFDKSNTLQVPAIQDLRWQAVVAKAGRRATASSSIPTSPDREFCGFRKKQCGVANRFPLRFHHSAPDNAVHKGQQRL
jgi:hypothetical protein